MKIKTIFIFISISILLLGCKSGDSLTKQEIINDITQKLESQNYTFIPSTAIPMGGKSIHLNYSYSLKVSKDTINSYLPYFGRAYVAPSPTDEGGIKFVCTDFVYTISDKKKGVWNVDIETKDGVKKYKLRLIVGDSGYTTLSVQDNSRQAISFYGKIE
ncbi:DUF4251 domain-containing protein [Dysgonomonas sp. Marseille-P4677]|uniref:DUF4251 domain-containing protein n=1 Tax=Dysgonomonas sp. Marseille-P4677 TaxID=2364790 RepID=UPI001913E8A5|nr:DUF4251 domain-containing protein [Dysgonomonas sp. Marseille-P4677]MBK5719422.1 DUF4251 domain-containing protein [Dysgonomonas sp. Marseille-P4677]